MKTAADITIADNNGSVYIKLYDAENEQDGSMNAILSPQMTRVVAYEMLRKADQAEKWARDKEVNKNTIEGHDKVS